MAECGVVSLRNRSNVLPLAAVCFGVGILVSCIFPSCLVLIMTAAALIAVGIIAFRC